MCNCNTEFCVCVVEPAGGLKMDRDEDTIANQFTLITHLTSQLPLLLGRQTHFLHAKGVHTHLPLPGAWFRKPGMTSAIWALCWLERDEHVLYKDQQLTDWLTVSLFKTASLQCQIKLLTSKHSHFSLVWKMGINKDAKTDVLKLTLPRCSFFAQVDKQPVFASLTILTPHKYNDPFSVFAGNSDNP